MDYNQALIQIAQSVDLSAHQQAHTAVLRQLIDAAQISNRPMTVHYWEKEIDFD